jgi:hypothetical protein
MKINSIKFVHYCENKAFKTMRMHIDNDFQIFFLHTPHEKSTIMKTEKCEKHVECILYVKNNVT